MQIHSHLKDEHGADFRSTRGARKSLHQLQATTLEGFHHTEGGIALAKMARTRSPYNHNINTSIDHW